MATRSLNKSHLESIVAVLAPDGVIYLDQVTKVCESGPLWKSMILLLPLRLGLDKFNEKYGPALLDCFHLPWSLGFVGGKPKSSLYFVGHQGTNLLYLDPHVVRLALSPENDFTALNTEFHCDEVNGLPLEDLDPSLAIG